MLTSILSAVCALALGSSAMTSQADTVNVYMINGEKVTNFDGSQLCGKTVSDYRIGVATNNATGEVSKYISSRRRSMCHRSNLMESR